MLEYSWLHLWLWGSKTVIFGLFRSMVMHPISQNTFVKGLAILYWVQKSRKSFSSLIYVAGKNAFFSKYFVFLFGKKNCGNVSLFFPVEWRLMIERIEPSLFHPTPPVVRRLTQILFHCTFLLLQIKMSSLPIFLIFSIISIVQGQCPDNCLCISRGMQSCTIKNCADNLDITIKTQLISGKLCPHHVTQFMDNQHGPLILTSDFCGELENCR